MAAFETPWLHQMSSFAKGHDPGLPKTTLDQSPVTIASFSPGQTASRGKQRRTVLVQHKSPLLTATPPQITRALAFSHPFILPLNKLVGLISWSSGDPWESFLIIAVFWALTIYGGVLVRLTGPILVVVILILGMYSRRYSPLSSTGWTGEKVKNQKRDEFDGTTSHQKSLDEIVDTLNVFTYRCNILLSPLLGLTDFLSTQRTATSATTRPALTTLLIRILMLSPLWVTLSMTPFNIITTPRVVLAVGTLGLSWHSRPARISRTILWRSITIRKAVSALTGLDFEKPISDKSAPPLPPRNKSQYDLASSIASTGTSSDNGVRFTFTVYENQRRWLGLGWTSSMFAYERTPWSDEHLNPSASKEEFLLPTVENGNAVWQWVPGSDWHFESTKKSSVLVEASKSSSEGWIYYDNKWTDGRRQDGWGRYTRRRKWYRDAELVERTQDTNAKVAELPATEVKGGSETLLYSQIDARGDPGSPASVNEAGDSVNSSTKRRGFFRRNSRTSAQSSTQSNRTLFASDDEQDHQAIPERAEREGDWNVGDEIKMGLG